MTSASATLQAKRLPPDVNRVLLVKNLPFTITVDEIYDLFGKYGAIRQVRVSDSNETKGTAFVIYEDIYDARNACTHLSGFNVKGRYLVVSYFKSDVNQEKDKKDVKKQLEELAELRKSMQTD